MSTGNRRSASSSAAAAPAAVCGPPTSSIAKRPASENAGKVSAMAAPRHGKKRVALAALTTNQRVDERIAAWPPAAKVTKVSNAPVARIGGTGTQKKAAKPDASSIPNAAAISLRSNDALASTSCAALVPCRTSASRTNSRDSLSLDESMSTCDSMKNAEFEYMDNGDSPVVASLKQQTDENPCIVGQKDAGSGFAWKGDSPVPIDPIDADSNDTDPQQCARIACDIYQHLSLAEKKHRPSSDYMETTQKEINTNMRAILVDWLVEVAEEYRLVSDTLYLTVNCVDRYLSGNEMIRPRLQLLGITCMLIASKYEEICAPHVEEFCYITDNSYVKEEMLEMEAAVLKYLKFQVTVPSTKCFLRRFVRAAQACTEVPKLQLQLLASYAAELSLLEYDMLRFLPSLIAAASVFLARFMLQPSMRPWCSTMVHYSRYKASDLCECVRGLHTLIGGGGTLVAIREKYSSHKYKFVARTPCPLEIPLEFFGDSMELPKKTI